MILVSILYFVNVLNPLMYFINMYKVKIMYFKVKSHGHFAMKMHKIQLFGQYSHI